MSVGSLETRSSSSRDRQAVLWQLMSLGSVANRGATLAGFIAGTPPSKPYLTTPAAHGSFAEMPHAN